jgi:hypothetical protein
MLVCALSTLISLTMALPVIKIENLIGGPTLLPPLSSVNDNEPQTEKRNVSFQAFFVSFVLPPSKVSLWLTDLFFVFRSKGLTYFFCAVKVRAFLLSDQGVCESEWFDFETC